MTYNPGRPCPKAQNTQQRVMIMKHLLPLKIVFLALVVAACSSSQTRDDSDTGTVDGDGAMTKPALIDPSNPDTWTLDDPASPVYNKVVYFDFDRSDIRSQDRATIVAHGQFITSHQTAQVTLEGHADERGTREYNLALGERRAMAVADLLRAQGASASQLRTVSYGEERPVATCHDNECWSQNRRVEIVYTSL